MPSGAESSFSVCTLPQEVHVGLVCDPKGIDSSNVVWQAVQRKSKRGMESVYGKTQGQTVFLLPLKSDVSGLMKHFLAT